MAEVGEATIRLRAETEEFVRDVNRARRRIQFHGVVLPMAVGFTLALVAGTVGFLLGLAA